MVSRNSFSLSKRATNFGYILCLLSVWLWCSDVVLAEDMAIQKSAPHELTTQESATLTSTAAQTESNPVYSKKGADTCLSCHNDDNMLLIFRTPHGQGADPSTPFAHQQCESCHGAGSEHTGRSKTGLEQKPIIRFGHGKDKTAVDEQNNICMECHSSDVGIPWKGSAHERNDTACVDCHTLHKTVDPVSRQTTQADVCFECHKQQKADSLKPSAHPVRFGIMTCTDCHSPHHSVTDALLKKNTINELCWSCHTDLRGPYLFEHPPATNDCTLCHTSHGSIHTPLLTRRGPLLCQTCHSASGHPSVSFTANSLAGNNPSAFVVGRNCSNCHSQVHGSNHPSGTNLMR